MSLSPELRARVALEIMEVAYNVSSAIGWLDAKNLPDDVNDHINEMGEAMTKLAQLLKDVVDEAIDDDH